MQNRMRILVVTSVAVLALGGCASKGWVRDLVGQKEAQIDERITQVETEVSRDGERITGVAGRVGAVETQIGQVEGQVAEQHRRVEGMGSRVDGVERAAGEAGQTSRAAMAKADGVDARVTRLWGNRYRRSVVDTVSIPFGFDRADLSDGAQTALIDVARELQANATLTVQLEGYTDSRGSREYNYTLSQRRVEAVRRFLVRQGIELDRIQSVGLGPLDDRAVPERDKRRVTVKLLTDSD